MDIIKRSGLLIPVKYKDSNAYVKIKEHLERRTREYNSSVYTVNTFYLESEKFLLIPRNFPLQSYILDYNIHDHRRDGKRIDIKHNITLRSETQKRAVDFYMSHENGIIQLSPGVGKTVITIYMISERKRKSLILVHRDSLATQWIERFLEFTNLKKNDISRLTSSTFKDDLQKSIIIATNQTFISLLKRNREEFLIALNEAEIGVFVADEVHTSVGAPTFAECSIHVPSKYCYGLSATPYRFDGNGDIIEYHLGEIFTDNNDSDTMSAKVTVFLLDYEIDTARRTTYIRWGGSFQRSRYLNLMKKSQPFRSVLKGLLNKLKSERNIICIAERIKLIDELYTELSHPSKSKFYRSEGLEALKEQVTFSTPGKCRDGIDAPWKDCVIMTSPISNIDQLTGRVVRTFKDKKEPAVIDMVDYGCEDIKNSFYKRKEFYTRKGWKVQYILVSSDGLTSIDEDRAMTILTGRVT